MREPIRLTYMTLATLALLSGSACSDKKIQRAFEGGDITVDGVPLEWADASYFEADRFDMAVANTGEHLFVSLKGKDDGLRRQLIGRGLVLWIDPQGGKKKHMGIRFPIGMMQNRSGERQRRPPESGGEGDFQARLQQALQELEILIPGKDIKRRMPVSAAGGIEVAVAMTEGQVTYEIKLPLHAGEHIPYAVEPVGETVGIGLEMSQARRARAGGRGGGGRGGGGGFGATGESRPGIARGPGPSRGGAGTSDFWTTAQLTK